MKASEAHALGDGELVEKLKDAREEAFNLRLKHATGELEDTARLPLGARRRPAADDRPRARHRPRQGTEELMSEETENERPRRRHGGRGRGPRRPLPRRPRRGPCAEPAAEPEQEPAEVLTRRSARKRARGAHSGEAGPQRGGEQRAADRIAERKAQGRRALAATAPAAKAKRTEQGHRHAAGRARRGHQEGAPGHRHLGEGRQDDHGRRAERPPPPLLREDRPPLEVAARARRAQRGRRGRHRPRDRDAADVEDQALAPGRDRRRREGANDPAGIETQGRRQLRRARDPLHPRQGRPPPPLRVASAT